MYCKFAHRKPDVGNRAHPICELCSKLNRHCVYPTQAGKPGPKPGWRRKPSVTNNQLPEALHELNSQVADISRYSSTTHLIESSTTFVTSPTAGHSPNVLMSDDNHISTHVSPSLAV